jgi:hypothetical protein
MRCRVFLRSFVIGTFAVVLAPSIVHAQSTIAGVVKDASGAVLPGVTVEAASPVLIEKTRSVITNGEGRYAIVDIRPGTYTVTFSLTGFNTFKREGVDVPTNVSVPINAEMKVGALEETVTVSGASPVVDVQNTAKVNVMSRDLIDTIPSARNLQSVGALVPGIRLNIPDVGGAQQTEQTYMATHGNASLHNTVLLDGMPAQTNLVDGQVQNYIDNALIAEATYQTSGVTAESSGGGVRVNMIPKDGGNTVHGSGFFGGSADSWHLQADNLTPDLVARGLKTGARIQHINDFNGAVGGPIVKDKLWYFGSGRYQSTYLQIPNTFNTDGSPGIEDADIKSFVVRGTWQATPRNKFAALYQRNYKWKGHEISSGGQTGLPATPDISATRRDPLLYYIGQVKWTSPITNKLLAEVGYSTDILHYSSLYEPGIGQERGTPAWFATATHLNTTTSLRTVAGQYNQWFYPNQDSAVGSLTYVTGSHTVKTGMLWGFGSNGYVNDMNADLWQNYQNSGTGQIPVSVTVFNSPLSTYPELKANIGLYVQDQWAFKKVTLNYGIRYEYLKEEIPAQDRLAGRFAPAVHYDAVTCQSMPGMTCWSTWSPRLGVAYDVFGDGKTALKASFGRYQRPDVSTFSNQFNPVALAFENRTWTDTDRSGQNLPTNGDGIAQDNEIGPSGNPNFGKVTNRTLDPNFKREYNQQYSAGIQHELRPGMAVTFNWYRRTLFNTQFSDNYSVNAIYQGPDANWSPVTIANPLNGEQITAFQINQNKFGVAPDTHLSAFTDTNTRRNVYTGFELGTNARLARRTLLFAGWTFERAIDVTCNSTDDPNLFRFCDQSGNSLLGEPAVHIPYLHEFKLNGSLPLWYGFEISASLQSYAGAAKATTNAVDNGGLTWTVTRGVTRYPSDCAVPGCTPGAIVLPSRFAGDPAITVRLGTPGTRYEPRWNQLDFAVSRIFKFGATQVRAQVNLFNALNANPVLTEGTALGSNVPIAPYLSTDPNTGGTPLSILQPRIIQLGAQIRF